MAIWLGLSDPADLDALLEAIIENVWDQQNHTTCGEIGHVYLLRSLASNGRSDIVYDIHTQTDIAGYGFMLANGATALSEIWNFELSASHNHAMFGHIEEWFYEYLGGIQFSIENIVIKPTPVADLEFVNVTFKSVFGPIESSWKMDRSTGLFQLFVNVPVNARATVTIPSAGGEVWESGEVVGEREKGRGWEDRGVVLVRRTHNECVVQVGSGEYHFASKLV
eukprot:Phypoly_transcript_15804.p1 GENE.Phypoly_transcript_15804~~Phypoly_transcript_15804.p1  ORF type:complete len:223 (+),score=31.62 Phypoly_transcript_15804:87-755(+)